MENEEGSAIAIASGNINIYVEDPNKGYGQALLSKIPTMITKRTGYIVKIEKILSEQSLENQNLERYKHMANKVNLSNIAIPKNADKPNEGKVFIINHELSYHNAKERKKEFTKTIEEKYGIKFKPKDKNTIGWNI